MRQGLIQLRPLGHKRLVVSTAVVSLADSDIPKGTVAFLMQAEGVNAARWTADGSTPASGSAGMLISSSVQPQLLPFRPGTMKFIRDGAADAPLLFTFFGE